MSKITYWKCVDCNSMINDLNMHEDNGMYLEFCYGCMNYNPQVVLAYDWTRQSWWKVTERGRWHAFSVSTAGGQGKRPKGGGMPRWPHMAVRYCARCYRRVHFKGRYAPWNVHCNVCRIKTGRYHGPE